MEELEEMQVMLMMGKAVAVAVEEVALCGEQQMLDRMKQDSECC